MLTDDDRRLLVGVPVTLAEPLKTGENTATVGGKTATITVD